MPKKRHRNHEDLSVYASMSTEELEELLRLDSEAPAGKELNTDVLLYILGVLAERAKSANSTGKTSHQAWDSFTKEYLPCEDSSLKSEIAWNNPFKKWSPWIRRGAIAALVLALVLFNPFTAKALGVDKLWNRIATWSEGIFMFVREDAPNSVSVSTTDPTEYTSLQEALVLRSLDPGVVPSRIPEGYVFSNMDISERPVWANFIAYYYRGQERMQISVCYSQEDLDPTAYEISSDLIECYVANDIEYYIFNNNSRLVAIWRHGPYECYITGILSLEEMKDMIDSISIGETSDE